jgi:ATP-dependent protease ClpP protease subunit
MNWTDLEAKARATWDATPVLQYAFVDFSAFFQTQFALDRARDAVVLGYVPQWLDAHKAEAEAAQHRFALVRRPASTQAQAGLIERQGNRLVIWLYGQLVDTGEVGAVGSRIAEALKQNRDAGAAIFRISSCGGHLDGLTRIRQAIASFPGRTIALVDHFSMSAAACLAICCDRVVMRRNAVMMFHHVMRTATGNADVLLKESMDLRAADSRVLAMLIATRRKTKPAVIRAAMDSERYIGADEALSLGLADAIAPALFGSDQLIAQALPEVRQ